MSSTSSSSLSSSSIPESSSSSSVGEVVEKIKEYVKPKEPIKKSHPTVVVPSKTKPTSVFEKEVYSETLKWYRDNFPRFLKSTSTVVFNILLGLSVLLVVSFLIWLLLLLLLRFKGDKDKKKKKSLLKSGWWLLGTAVLLISIGITMNLLQVSSQSWKPLIQLYPKPFSFAVKFDSTVQNGAISYLNELDKFDLLDVSSLQKLNERYWHLNEMLDSFSSDCAEKEIIEKQKQFYDSMIGYQSALEKGNASDMKSAILKSIIHLEELRDLLISYGYATN